MKAGGTFWRIRSPQMLGAGGLVLGLLMASDRLLGLLQNTGTLVLASWAVALPLSILLALAVSKMDLPTSGALRILLVATLFVPLYVWAGAWQAGLTRGGWASDWAPAWLGDPGFAGWPATIWIHGMAGLPWAALLTAAALATIERPLEEQSLVDAPPWKVLGRVSLRRASSGIAAGALWIAATAATEIVATDLFQVRTFAEEAFVEASIGSLVDERRLAATDFALGWAALVLATWLGLSAVAPGLPAAADASLETCWRWRPRRARWLLGWMVLLLALVLFAAPLASLFWKAGLQWQDGDQAFSARKATMLILRSPWIFRREWQWTLLSSGLAATAVTCLALSGGWLATRRPGYHGPLIGVVALLGAAPGPLLGVATIRLLNQPADSAGYWLTQLYDRTLLGPVLVQTLRALPLALLYLWAQMTTVPPSLIDAARSEGAGWWTQLWRIAAPLRWRAIAACWFAALFMAAGETSGVLLVSPPGATLLSVRIFGLLHYGADDQVAAVCLSWVLLVVLVAAPAFWWFTASRPLTPDPVESIGKPPRD